MSTYDFWTDGNETEPLGSRRRQGSEAQPQRLRHNTFAKRKRPTGYNGIHRRRNKKSAW